MEAKKSKRGGARAGAGRKPKGHVAPTRLDALTIRASMLTATPDAIENSAQSHATIAIDNLVIVLRAGESDAARIAAANTILDRGYGKPSVDTGIDQRLPLFEAPSTSNIHGSTREYARRFALLAIETLKIISAKSESEAARVSASKSLLDRGLGMVAPARMTSSDVAAAEPERKQSTWDTLVQH